MIVTTLEYLGIKTPIGAWSFIVIIEPGLAKL